jgi:hypothetical protein
LQASLTILTSWSSAFEPRPKYGYIITPRKKKKTWNTDEQLNILIADTEYENLILQETEACRAMYAVWIKLPMGYRPNFKKRVPAAWR